MLVETSILFWYYWRSPLNSEKNSMAFQKARLKVVLELHVSRKIFPLKISATNPTTATTHTQSCICAHREERRRWNTSKLLLPCELLWEDPHCGGTFPDWTTWEGEWSRAPAATPCSLLNDDFMSSVTLNCSCSDFPCHDGQEPNKTLSPLGCF